MDAKLKDLTDRVCFLLKNTPHGNLRQSGFWEVYADWFKCIEEKKYKEQLRGKDPSKSEEK